MAVTQSVLPEVIAKLRGGLIVSCQALPHEPLQRLGDHGAHGVGGVAGRCGRHSRQHARRHSRDPLRGAAARGRPVRSGRGGRLHYAHLGHARAVVAAGAHIVALDATSRPRPDGRSLGEVIAALHAESGALVMADISTVGEALAAEALGADVVSTTLSGYTSYSPQSKEPNLELVAELAARLTVPVVAEDRIGTPAQVRAALDSGAFAVVVGAAITRPHWITTRFVAGMKAKSRRLSLAGGPSRRRRAVAICLSR